MDTIFLVIGAFLLASASAFIVYLLRQLQLSKIGETSTKEQLNAKLNELSAVLLTSEQLSQENSSLKEDLRLRREELISLRVRSELEEKQLKEKLTLLNESRDELGSTFKNIANEIFEDRSKKFAVANKESLSAILSPLEEKIQKFEKRVEETYINESKERFALTNQIENLQKLNARISEDAVNLTNALTADNKVQGTWGEMALEKILDISGLVKGREYDIQVSLKDEGGGRAQPDVVIHLPESRDIIVDSKVSLKAWIAYCGAETASIKAEAIKSLVESVRNHVKLLSNKDYQNLEGVNSLDYVFLFMPIEAAYAKAMQEDKDLFQFAFDRNIIFVVPTTLLTTLKTVQNLWRLAQQNQNANEIAKRAGALYDKFVAFVGDLDDVGQRIESSRVSFDRARSKLSTGKGNLIRRAEILKELGAKTSKKQNSELLRSSEPDDSSSPSVSSNSNSIEHVDEGDKNTQH
ncbi:MAG: DNA recombination protein RmuC [Gammaproteobacteria bacterium]|nr:DNA recombination protein RmuC [Gammaproteobacteria bacterium]